MAMLAEPRRRQKLSFDPRNKAWSDDSSKFGQRLMEQMGWAKGKGLGAKEDGSLDHVKVSLKNNNLGVGCKANHEDNWIAHQDDFNDLLSSLGQDHAPSQQPEAEAKSLEERSKKSKSRVHYQKFVRGKDMSRYGAEGMKSIFGKRKTHSAPVTPQTQSVENSDDNEEAESDGDEQKEDVSHGVVTIRSSCSVQEYFAQKMSAIKKNRRRQESESHSDTELDLPRCGFGFSAGPSGSNQAGTSGQVDPPRGGFGFKAGSSGEKSFNRAGTSGKAEAKRKSSWIIGGSDSDSGDDDSGTRKAVPGPSGLNAAEDVVGIKRPEDVPGPSGFRSKKQKLEKTSSAELSLEAEENDEGGIEGEEEMDVDSEEAQHTERSKGKKKKKRKKKSKGRTVHSRESDEEVVAPVEVRGQSEEEDEGIDMGRKKKKNKKKKRLMDEMVVESRSDSSSEKNAAAENGERKKKKKTKKSKKDKSRKNEESVGHSCSHEEEDTADMSEGRSGGETTCSKKRKDSSEEGLNGEGEEPNLSKKKRKRDRREKGEKEEERDGGESSSIKKKKKKKHKM